jgi:hypothetical protein
MVAARFVWHGMNKQVGMWAKTCLSCQKAKVQFLLHSNMASYQTAGSSVFMLIS